MKYLVKWGFRPGHYTLNLEEIDLSDSQLGFCKKYVDTIYPTEGLVFLAPPKKSIQLVSILVKLLYTGNHFKNRVSIIDVPTVLLDNNFGYDYQDQRNRLKEDLVNSDLVVLNEVGLTKWSSAQRARLYTLLYERYERELPIFATHYGTSDDLEENIGAPNFFRIADTCKFLEIKEKE